MIVIVLAIVSNMNSSNNNSRDANDKRGIAFPDEPPESRRSNYIYIYIYESVYIYIYIYVVISMLKRATRELANYCGL